MAIITRKMKVDDIADVRGVDLLAWNDLMEKTYGPKVRLTPRSDENILSYLHSDPDGAFVGVDELVGVVGSCFSHVWGTTGWVGPLSVVPSYQTKGIGKDLLKSSLRYLEDQGCVDIGLETMPESAGNIGMYLKVGLRPEGMVVILAKALAQHEVPEEPVGAISVERFSESQVQDDLKSRIRGLSNSLRFGLDYTKEVELTQEYSFGDTILATSKGRVVGFCIVHTTPRRVNSSGAAIRAMATDPASEGEVLDALLSSAELLAADANSPEIAIGMPAQSRRALDAAFSRGYTVIESLERLMWMGSSGMSEKLNNLCSWSG